MTYRGMTQVRKPHEPLTPHEREETKISFYGTPVLVQKQEAAALEMNNIVMRGYAGQPRPLVYGERDYDLDLERAFQLRDLGNATWNNLPPELKAKYPTWPKFLEAVDNGTIELIDSDPPAAQPPQPPQ